MPKNFLPFEEARNLAGSLGLKNWHAWLKYCKSGDKPRNIPSNPHVTYKDKGWCGYGDWLGTGNTYSKEFLPFEEARAFARNVAFKNKKEWRQYCKSGDKPRNIPSGPDIKYKDKGWVNWGDWLGNGNTFNLSKEFFPYEEARDFARNLGLKNTREWKEYKTSGNRTISIPSCPDIKYKDKGWVNWADWLGTNNKRGGRKKDFLPFVEARDFVRNLGLKNLKEWKIYCTSGSKPENITSVPDKTYKDKGWVNLGDWLGTDNKRGARKYDFLPFVEAKDFARNLGLKNVREWLKYCKSGDKPDNIPSIPSITYKDKGWINWYDWLI